MIYQTPGIIDYAETGEGPTVVLVPGHQYRRGLAAGDGSLAGNYAA